MLILSKKVPAKPVKFSKGKFMNQILQPQPEEEKSGSLLNCPDEAERIRFYQAATDTLLAPWTEF